MTTPCKGPRARVDVFTPAGRAARHPEDAGAACCQAELAAKVLARVDLEVHGLRQFRVQSPGKPRRGRSGRSVQGQDEALAAARCWYVGAHYPSDVLAGFAVGGAAAAMTLRWWPRRPPVPAAAIRPPRQS
ncbi:MAG TPA: phosphatase PAP2 family protein [Streptosporangiaceae bacterium]